MPLITCPDCGNKLSPQARICPQCGRPMNSSITKSQTTNTRTCPYCGSSEVKKGRGLHGLPEFAIAIFLLLLLFIPGIIYYAYMESIPFCSG